MALTTIIPNLPYPAVPVSRNQSVSHITNGLTTDVNNVQFPLQAGVPIQNIYTFKVIPSTISATAVAPVYNFGAIGSAGYIPLQTAVQGTYPNIQSQPIVFLGQPGILLDCERCLALYFSKATEASFQVIITGYDYRGVTTRTSSAVINAGQTAAYSIPSPITVVTSIYFAQNPFPEGDGTVSVGTNNYIGLPYLLINDAHVIYSSWNNNTLSTYTGAINPGYQWRQVGSVNPTTGPCARGFVNLGSFAPNNTAQLIVTYYVYGSDSEINGEIVNLNQSSVKIVGVKNNVSGVPVLPYLVSQDLTGIQIDNGDLPGLNPNSLIPGDAAFFVAYQTALAV